MYVVEYVVGLLIVIVTVLSVLFILVLPRQPQGLEKMTLIVNKSVHFTFVALSRFARPTRARTPSSRLPRPSPSSPNSSSGRCRLVFGFALMLMTRPTPLGSP